MHKTRVEVAEEKAMERGLERGRRAGLLEVLEAQIASRFGSLSEESLTKLRALTDAELQHLSLRILTATTLADLGL